ncbi:MAG: helix-turn-helix domain-containing protein [Pseudomonadota bacterium]
MKKQTLSPQSKPLKKSGESTKTKPSVRRRTMACSMELNGSESQSPKAPAPPHSWKNPKYTVDMCDRIQPWYEDGQSDAEVANQLDIALSTFYVWRERYMEFGLAVKRGQDKSQAWWQNLGKDLSKGVVKGSDKVWLIMMKNRFQFRDTIVLEDCNHFGLNRTVKELKELVALHKKHEADY